MQAQCTLLSSTADLDYPDFVKHMHECDVHNKSLLSLPPSLTLLKAWLMCQNCIKIIFAAFASISITTELNC